MLWIERCPPSFSHRSVARSSHSCCFYLLVMGECLEYETILRLCPCGAAHTDGCPNRRFCSYQNKSFQLCVRTHIQQGRRKCKVIESLDLGWAAGLSKGFSIRADAREPDGKLGEVYPKQGAAVLKHKRPHGLAAGSAIRRVFSMIRQHPSFFLQFRGSDITTNEDFK